MNQARVATVVYNRKSRPDTMFAAVISRLKGRQVSVGGLLQEPRSEDRVHATLALQDIASGRRVRILENRGVDARGCRLDPAGLAQAAAFLREAIEARPEVLFVNRFGRQEAEGGGLVDEIAAAVLADIPLVIAVGAALTKDWIAYAGGAGDIVGEADALEAWCLRQSIGAERSTAAAA